jgi:hypothetical protein
MWRLPHFLDSLFTDGSEVSLMLWLPFTPRKIPGIHFSRGCVDPRAIIQLEGLDQF